MNDKHKIAQLLDNHRGEKHLVVLHDYPDPDAISSAFAYRLIAAEYDIEASIIYTGKISHSQNKALVKLLDIDLTPYEGRLDLANTRERFPGQPGDSWTTRGQRLTE